MPTLHHPKLPGQPIEVGGGSLHWELLGWVEMPSPVEDEGTDAAGAVPADTTETEQ